MREDIETVIDRLLDFVRSNGRVHINEAARALALSPGQVEKLGLLLEESKLLEVQYTLGGVYLKAAEDADAAARSGAPLPAKESPLLAADSRRSQVLQEIQRLEHEVLTSENLLHFFEHDITRRLLLTQSILEDLEEKQSFTQEELDTVRKEIHLAEQQLASFGTEIASLSSSQSRLQKRLQAFSGRLSKLTAAPHAHAAVESAGIRSLLSKLQNVLTEWFAFLRASLAASGIILTKRRASEPLFPRFTLPAVHSSVNNAALPWTYPAVLGRGRQSSARLHHVHVHHLRRSASFPPSVRRPLPALASSVPSPAHVDLLPPLQARVKTYTSSGRGVPAKHGVSGQAHNPRTRRGRHHRTSRQTSQVASS